MKTRLLFIQRRESEFVSIDRVFRQVARNISKGEFDVEFQNVPYGSGFAAVIKNLIFFRPQPADIYHITGDINYIALRLPAKKTLLTIHDLIFLKRRSGPRRLILKKLYLDWPLRRVSAITAISDATKNELIKETGIDAAMIEVIENPLTESFIGDAEGQFNAVRPTILQIGTAENKNISRLISALQGIDCKLRIVGRLDEECTRQLAASDIRYEIISGLDDLQMVEEYRKTDIVTFCSTYEGFGLPIIEAQATQRPVVTSDLAPMNTVAGAGAALVDPYRVESIAAAVKRVINDGEYRRSIVTAGIENVKRFDGNTIAAKYAAIYRRMTDMKVDRKNSR